jgi:D-amino-acid dehydrogenase
MRVAVLGGGIIGLCCAHYLRKGGANVVVIERDRVGGGCSYGNAGWVCPSISAPLPTPDLTVASLWSLLRPDGPLYIKPSALPTLGRWLWAFRRHCNAVSYASGVKAFAALNVVTRELYQGLQADGVEFEMAESGTLIVYSDERSLSRSCAEIEALEEFGVGPVDILDRAGVGDAAPSLEGDSVGGLIVRSDFRVRSDTLCEGLATHLVGRGVEVIEGFEVTNFVRDGTVTKSAIGPDGEIEADAFLLAAGAETSLLSAKLNAPLPVQAGKGYSITVENPRATLSRPTYLANAKIGFTPFDSSIRIVGTMEMSGINLQFDVRRILVLERATRHHLPGALQGDGRVDWVGMRPITPDGLPVLGALPASDNTFVATGHQMLGVTLAPATGKALAQLILKDRFEIDLTSFDPVRFQ